MEVVEVIVYVILTFILAILIGVISWVTYDYYKYKDEQEKKLTNTFTKYKETDDSLTKDITSSSNLLYKYSSNLDLNSSNYIKGLYDNTSKIIGVESKKSIDNTSNFNHNLSKYFKFGTDGNGGISGFNSKLYEYTMWDATKDSKIELINETTAAAGLRLKTDINSGLNICDKTGAVCYNLYVNGNNLHIKPPATGVGAVPGNVMWGEAGSVDYFAKNSQLSLLSTTLSNSGGTQPLTAAEITRVTGLATDAGLAADSAALAAVSATTLANTATTEVNQLPAGSLTEAKTAAKTKALTAATDALSASALALEKGAAANLAADVNGVEAATKTSVKVQAANAIEKGNLAKKAGDNANTAGNSIVV
jgi:hypothetical protein